MIFASFVLGIHERVDAVEYDEIYCLSFCDLK